MNIYQHNITTFPIIPRAESNLIYFLNNNCSFIKMIYSIHRGNSYESKSSMNIFSSTDICNFGLTLRDTIIVSSIEIKMTQGLQTMLSCTSIRFLKSSN